jgi:hypothetical protein
MCIYWIGFVCAVGWFLMIRNVTITVHKESLNNLRIMHCHPYVLICVCCRIWVWPAYLSSVRSLLPWWSRSAVMWWLWDRHHNLHEGDVSSYNFSVILYPLFLGQEMSMYMDMHHMLLQWCWLVCCGKGGCRLRSSVCIPYSRSSWSNLKSQ